MASIQIKPIAALTWTTISSISSLQMNWEINRAGMLNVTMPIPAMRDALAAIKQLPGSANTTTLAGMEIKHEDESAGSWGGLITQVSVSDGVATISAMTYEIVLRKKIIDIDTAGNADNRKHPGKVLADLISQYNNASGSEAPKIKLIVPTANSNDPTFDLSGNDDVRVNAKADAYDEIIPQLTEDIGYEWQVDANRKVSFGKRLGSDLSSSVVLTEGVHITSAQWADDFLAVTNSLRGYCTVTTNAGSKKKPKWTETIASAGWPKPDNPTDSVMQFGILRERRDYPNIDSQTSLEKQLKLEVAVTQAMIPSITVEVVNVGNIWSRFRQGDIVRLELGFSDYKGNFRIMVRSYDVGRGIMVCSGYGDPRIG